MNCVCVYERENVTTERIIGHRNEKVNRVAAASTRMCALRVCDQMAAAGGEFNGGWVVEVLLTLQQGSIRIRRRIERYLLCRVRGGGTHLTVNRERRTPMQP